MKVRIVICLLLALIASSCVYCIADDGSDISGDAYVLYNYNEFRSNAIRVYEAERVDQLDYMVSSYINRTMGVYLPEGIEIGDITEIYLYPTYCAVGFEYDGVMFQLSFYYKQYGEDFSYNMVREYYYVRYNGQILTTGDGTTVYYYEDTFSGMDQVYYFWLQDDMTFSLCAKTLEYSDEFLSLCSAVYHSFYDYVPSVEYAVSDGKVTLSWDKTDDKSYTVYWKRSSSDEWKVAGTTAKHKVNITGLKNGISYDFKVEISGEDSEVVTATPTDDIDYMDLPEKDGFGNNFNGRTYDDSGKVSVVVSEVTSEGLTVVLINKSDIDVSSSGMFFLQEYRDSEWQYPYAEYTVTDSNAFEYYAHANGGETSIQIVFSTLYQELSAGHYRLLQYYYYEEDGERVNVYGICGFDIE